MQDPGDLDGLPTIPVESVRDGDLIFTARPGQLQSLALMAGDPWRHVGVATTVDGQMSCCEVAGDSFQFRALERIATPPHTAVGVARFDRSRADCATAAAEWVTRMVSEQNLYAWDDVILAGLLLAVRRRVPPRSLDAAMAVIRAAESLAREQPPPKDRRSFTCSSFVYHAFAQAGPTCRPEVKIEAVRTRPPRHRAGTLAPPPNLADLLAEAERGNLDALSEPLLQYSLLELSGAVTPPTAGRTRVASTTHIDADQFIAIIRNLVRIFANVNTRDLPSRLVVDERWVSPGDLWRLESLELRALLPIRDVEAGT